MRIFDRAMSRVRGGLLARPSARQDGGHGRAQGKTAPPPASALTQALTWLGSELRGDAVPQRLRDAAGRLASLLDSQLGQAGSQGTEAVVALEDALAANATRSLEQPSQMSLEAGQQDTDGAHGHDRSAAAVCPFTGVRADGALLAPAPPATSASVADVEARGSAREQADAREQVQAGVSSLEGAPEPGPSTTSARPRRKNKERLAGAQSVENTSARSATRSARKQPRGRTQASRKKS